MNRELLDQVVAELAMLLPGARVDKVTQTVNGGFCLHLHRQRARHILLLSPDRRLPRIHLLMRRPESARSPSGFLLALRKRVAGTRIERIGTLHADRVVEIGFAGSRAPARVIFELIGASANLLLIDADGMIQSVLHPRSPEKSEHRTLLPGAEYRLPIKRNGPEGRCLSGIILPAGPEDDPAPVNRAFEVYIEQLLEDQETASMRRILRAAAGRSLGKAQRRVWAIAEDLKRAEHAEEYQRAGTVILANLGALRKGLAQTELTDHDGHTLTVNLDPARTPTENADAYFRRAKKARASLNRVRARLAAARAEVESLSQAGEDVTKAPDRDALLRIRDQLGSHGVVQDRQPAGSTLRASPSPAVRTVRYDGWEILIGKSAAGNDHITRTLAKPDDLWLHAEGMPGSHVLVRNPNQQAVPSAVLDRAASLAAYFSKGRGSTKVPVTYTAARYVKKPKGAKPGLAVLTERKTIMAEPQPV